MIRKSALLSFFMIILMSFMLCTQSREVRDDAAAGKKKTAPAVSASAKQVRSSSPKTYRAPKVAGVRVDWCLHFGRKCGRPAAERFCRSKGHSSAVGWRVQEGIGRTYIMGDKKACNARYCDGFKFIVCR